MSNVKHTVFCQCHRVLFSNLKTQNTKVRRRKRAITKLQKHESMMMKMQKHDDENFKKFAG